MPDEQPLSAETGMHPTPPPLPEDAKDGPERDAAFAPTNDSIWGPGNWVKCYQCPSDRKGNPVYHHIEAHQLDPAWGPDV